MQGSKRLFLPLMIAAVLFSGCGEKKGGTTEKGATQVAAKVNGTELTVSQVNFALQSGPKLDKDQLKAASLQAVRNLVDQEVIVQKALSDKFDRDPLVVQALDASRRQILAEAYMSRKLGAPTEPSDAEVTDYFNKHPELFSSRKVYRLQEITIKAPKNKQDAIRAQLGGSKTLSDFAAWLKSENIPVKMAEGVKPAEQLPLAIVPQLAKMRDGQAMVANGPDGMTVIVMAGAQEQPVTLEQAKPAISHLLQVQARQKAAKAELDKLKTAAKIEYVGEFADAGKQTAVPAAPTEPPAVPAAAPAADADAISKGVSGLK